MVVVNTSEPKIPVSLREAFAEALAQFLNWGSGDESRIVVDGKLTSISSVFFMVSGFSDPMPESIHRTALRCVSRSTDAVELIRDRSYGMAARILFRLAEAKKAGNGQR
jgi:hypothetical protein